MLGLGWLSSQIGRLGGAVKGGFQQLGQLGQQGRPGQFRTPGFNPNAQDDDGIGLRTNLNLLPGVDVGGNLPFTGANRGRPDFAIDVDMPLAPGTSVSGRETFGFQQQRGQDDGFLYKRPKPQSDGTAPQLPISRTPPGPPLTGYNRTPVQDYLPGPDMSDVATSTQPGDIPTRVPRRAVVDPPFVPPLPGKSGGNRPFDPMTAAKYEYVTERTPVDENGYFRKPTFGERLKTGLKTAGLGVAQSLATMPQGVNDEQAIGRAIGGAGTGFGLGLASPATSAEWQFDTFKRPVIEREQQRQRQAREQERADEMAAIDLEYSRGRIGQQKAVTDRENAHTKVYESQANQPYASAGWGTYNRTDGQPGYVRPDKPTNPPRPVTVRPGTTLLDPVSGKVIHSEPPLPKQTSPKARSVPAAAYQRLSKLDELKGLAENSWASAKSKPEGSPERARAEERARQAQANYNRSVENFGQIFGDHFETGAGEGGWGYVKPREQANDASAGGGGQKLFQAALLKDFAAEHKLDEAGARKLIESWGYSIR